MTNKEIVFKMYEELFNAHDVSKAKDYILADYIQHNPTVEQGLNGFIRFAEKFFEKKAKHDIILILEDGDLVAVYVYVIFSDGGKAVVADIFRLENGKMAEHWDSVQRIQ